MAKLTKEAYLGKAEYAAKKMVENEKVTSLTESQHEAIQAICAFRHELHCNQKRLFFTENGNYYSYWEMLSAESDDSIQGLIRTNELPSINISDGSLVDNDATFDMDIDFNTDEDRYEALDNAIWEVLEYAQQVNQVIEDWLAAIDSIHGTDYAPTGLSRIF